MPIKILLYEDNEALRGSVVLLLAEEPDFELQAAMPDAETVTTDIAELAPDVILMDIDMPGISGVEAVRRIRLVHPSLPVIMLTVFDDNENIFNAICAGASGYILKSYTMEELPGAIRDVLRGGAPMTGSVARKVLGMVPQAKNTEQESSGLTAKETAILQYLVKGYSYKMIAGACHISLDTVRGHIRNIYAKLHVNCGREAVVKALRDKIV